MNGPQALGTGSHGTRVCGQIRVEERYAYRKKIFTRMKLEADVPKQE